MQRCWVKAILEEWIVVRKWLIAGYSSKIIECTCSIISNTISNFQCLWIGKVDLDGILSLYPNSLTARPVLDGGDFDSRGARLANSSLRSSEKQSNHGFGSKRKALIDVAACFHAAMNAENDAFDDGNPSSQAPTLGTDDSDGGTIDDNETPEQKAVREKTRRQANNARER